MDPRKKVELIDELIQLVDQSALDGGEDMEAEGNESAEAPGAVSVEVTKASPGGLEPPAEKCPHCGK